MDESIPRAKARGNLSTHFHKLSEVLIREYKRKLNGDESSDSDPPLDEILPPNVLAVLKTDPILAEMIAESEDEKEESGNRSSEKEARVTDNEIHSLERLRSYVSTLEKANTLIREYLKTLSGPQTWDELIKNLSALEKRESNSDENDCVWMCPRVTILKSDFFGCPAGTRLVCINVMAFHMDLVRVDGRLRILNVYLADD